MNLHEVALLPAVRRVAQTIRGQFGVWVGLLEGESVVPFPGLDEHPLCNHFMANPLMVAGSASTCSTCVRSWANETRPVVSCHVGLDAILVPFRLGKLEGRLYASGFLSAESAAERMEHLRAILPPHLGEAELSEIPILDRRKRDVVSSLLKAMSDEIEDEAEELELDEGTRYGGMLGQSEPMQLLFNRLRRISTGNSTVLIEGENGTGKELIARAIHAHSTRQDMAFIAQNCAAIAPDLIASELFGHKKGSFSGAHRDRVGLFESANGGTFFLDEIGEMDISLQVKLLRVLQEGTFLPVGDNVVRKVNVRVLCATNRDLKEEVQAGRFREDLYYRVNVITITAPPLRHRLDDIPLLAKFFLDRACHRHDRPRKRFAPDALKELAEHTWPGNVRELENEVERLVIMTQDEPVIPASELRLHGNTRSDTAFTAIDLKLPDAVEKLERQMILESLRRTGWNKTKTAEQLGVSRRNLIRKIASYELEKQRHS